MQLDRYNIIIGWVIFAISSFVYLSTIEPTASFWDCGEFIATAYKLEVGHPPGAPFFMILGRLFAAFVPATSAAMAINVLSALSSSFTILFLFWTITAFAKKMALRTAAEEGKPGEKNNITIGQGIAILGSGAVGALCYTFSDSFWFSAVEGEVYAISSLFTAVVFWAIMKWDAEPDNPRSDRWIILIAYLMGLSIGVHLLNLLCIPAIALVVYFKRNELSLKGLVLTGVVSLAILGFIQAGIIPGIVKMAGGFELFFTNSLGTPFNVGVAVFAVLLIAMIIQVIMFSRKPSGPLRSGIAATAVLMIIPLLFNDFLSGTAKGFCFLMLGGIVTAVFMLKDSNRVLHLATVSFAVIMIGYSTFAMIVIRSSANPPMDENNPEHVFTLLSYLNREQYGDRPLLHGHYWMAPTTGSEDGAAVWSKDEEEGEYFISDKRKGTVYQYDDQFTGTLPRMYSNQPNHIDAYKSWSDFKGKQTTAKDAEGNRLRVPTAGENWKFFTRYQVNHMYWRYFMWNFAGRQNDVQGHGSILNGNWLSGIDMIDEQRLGSQDNLPSSMTNNKARNNFFFIPFLLGLIGLIYQLSRDTKNWLVVMLLFLLTGFAIVIYLNQYPYQPRERDYAYVGSFYAFTMWVGLGVYALFDAVRSMNQAAFVRILVAVIATGGLMYLLEGSTDHSFSYTVLFLGLSGAALMGVMYAAGKAIGDQGTALLATLLGLSVPVLMAADGWDDHNRSKRKTAVDIARNYLESCEPNAILFTNGDNDTFPLWYAQEVEGVRTDIRVVNLSLLNTDWYIEQMTRKAYDSDPVPFTIPESKYRQGTRDIVLMDPKGDGRRMDLDRAIDVAIDDKNQVPIRGMGSMPYFPTNKFQIRTDKRDLLARGIISAKDTAMVDNYMQWNVPGRYITKNNLMVLDLIAHNNWERPIYFAVTTGMSTYLNMQPYFKLTGMAYRLTPVKHEKDANPNKLGGVDTEKMYDNVMNKFTWGNMDTEELYMDENNLRLTTNVRLQLSNLADELIKEGKDDLAHDILDKTFEAMPERNVPLTRVVMPLIEGYARVGDLEKAEELGRKLFDITEEDVMYYTNLSPRFAAGLDEEVRIGLYVAQRMEYIARQYEMTELQKELGARSREMQASYERSKQEIAKAGRRGGTNIGL